MELPLRIIISFVVLLAVGMTVLNISNSMLHDTKTNIDNLNAEELKSKLIEKDSFTDTEILALAQNCYERYYGISKEELCYIIKSPSNINTALSTPGLVYPSFISPTPTAVAKTIYVTFSHPNVVISD